MSPAPAELKTAGETPEEKKGRVEQWLKETRTAFARVNEPDAEAQLPVGIDASELAEHRRNLEQTVLGINRYLKVVNAMPDARKGLEAARDADAAWTGFSEKPPYSILWLDQLVNQQDALQEKARSYVSSLALFDRTLTEIQQEGRAAEESSRRASAYAEQDSGDGGATKWRLVAGRANSRLLSVRATYLQANVALLQDQAETAKIQLSLLERQIAIIRKNVEFSDKDLAKVSQAAADRQAALRKEITGIIKSNQEATLAKARMQADVDKLEKEAATGTQIENSPELALTRVKMESKETRVDSFQHILESLESLDQLDSYVTEIYQKRRVLLQSSDKVARAAAMQSLRSALVRLTAWETVIENDLAAVDADIRNQESRANSMPAGDPRLVPLSDVRVALWDKQAVIQRVSQAVSAQRRLVQRWIDGFDKAYVEKPLSERISDATTTTWDSIKSVWHFEVFQYDDTVMLGGVPITEKRGVSLGKFIIAILAFCVAYFIATRIINRLRNLVIRHGHVAEAQAKTLGNWLMIVVGFLLAVGTLHFLKIPLTVFAFFGGALAIGLGFGTQTLIKNFISGIIVLFERKVRVGDVVDIGGTAGTVVEINTRSSVVRSPDGREALVPNSVFLENTITNLTLSNRSLRRAVTVGVAYGSSPQQVIAILTECAERHGLIHKDPPPLVIFQDFGDNALLFKLYIWVALDAKTNPELVESDLRMMIEKQFSEVGIGFPFPQRDMHLKTGSPLQIEWTPPAAATPNE
ncbi:MAG: mechanosensitive ion channel domain-containing protein [Luteolibacter sp.]